MRVFFFVCIFFFCFLTTLNATGLGNSSCLDKEEALSMLETAEDLLSKANDVYPTCNQTECGGNLPLSYMEMSKKLISDVRENFPTCPIIKVPQFKPRDCSEILTSGRNESGVYTIWPSESSTPGKQLQVYCDMETDYGGWTVIQRRGKYELQQDFYQDWDTYKNGFGNLTEEFWLGNENIRVLCYKGCEIRFDLQAKIGTKGYAVYKDFKLSKNSYTLYISQYKGDIGDLMPNSNNFAFSTKDKGDVVRAQQYQGGWWYYNGPPANHLNGIYQPSKTGYSSVVWYTWKYTENLASTEIKVRPK